MSKSQAHFEELRNATAEQYAYSVYPGTSNWQMVVLAHKAGADWARKYFEAKEAAKQINGTLRGYDGLVDNLNAWRAMAMEAIEALGEAKVVLDDNWFTTNDGEEYNNDDVIAMSEKVDKMLKRFAEMGKGDE